MTKTDILLKTCRAIEDVNSLSGHEAVKTSIKATLEEFKSMLDAFWHNMLTLNDGTKICKDKNDPLYKTIKLARNNLAKNFNIDVEEYFHD